MEAECECSLLKYYPENHTVSKMKWIERLQFLKFIVEQTGFL